MRQKVLEALQSMHDISGFTKYDLNLHIFFHIW